MKFEYTDLLAARMHSGSYDVYLAFYVTMGKYLKRDHLFLLEVLYASRRTV